MECLEIIFWLILFFLVIAILVVLSVLLGKTCCQNKSIIGFLSNFNTHLSVMSGKGYLYEFIHKGEVGVKKRYIELEEQVEENTKKLKVVIDKKILNEGVYKRERGEIIEKVPITVIALHLTKKSMKKENRIIKKYNPTYVPLDNNYMLQVDISVFFKIPSSISAKIVENYLSNIHHNSIDNLINNYLVEKTRDVVKASFASEYTNNKLNKGKCEELLKPIFEKEKLTDIKFEFGCRKVAKDDTV